MSDTYVSVAASGVIRPSRDFEPFEILSMNVSSPPSRARSDVGASASTNSALSQSLAMEKYQKGITAQYIQSGASALADHAMNTTPWNDATNEYPSFIAYFPSFEALKMAINGE